MQVARVIATAIVVAMLIVVFVVWSPSDEALTPAPEMSLDSVKARAQVLTYDQLARSPNVHSGLIVELRGKVIQVIENGLDVTLRVNVTPDKFDIWRDTVLVSCR